MLDIGHPQLPAASHPPAEAAGFYIYAAGGIVQSGCEPGDSDPKYCAQSDNQQQAVGPPIGSPLRPGGGIRHQRWGLYCDALLSRLFIEALPESLNLVVHPTTLGALGAYIRIL
jgi:hypothetical protein